LNSWGFPAPVPDELGHSVITRYIRSWAGLDKNGLLRQALGKTPSSMHPACPPHISALAKRALPHAINPTEQFFARHTMVPYYLSFEDAQSKSKTFALLSGDKTPSVAKVLNLTAWHAKKSAYLRFCPACHSEHLAEFGEGIWLRIHQLPGAFHCAKHGTPIRTSTTPICRNKFLQFLPPESETVQQSLVISEEPLFDPRLERRVIAMSNWLLNLPLGLSQAAQSDFRARLMQLDYRGRSNNLKTSQFETDFIHWLKLHKCEPYRIGTAMWWRCMITKVPGRATPLQNIILRLFLADRREKLARIQPSLFDVLDTEKHLRVDDDF
jgi:hypothetical protein